MTSAPMTAPHLPYRRIHTERKKWRSDTKRSVETHSLSESTNQSLEIVRFDAVIFIDSINCEIIVYILVRINK